MLGKKEDLVDFVFSWSVQDVLNETLYSTKLNTIPEVFSSTGEYFEAFVYPLLEETRADLQSSLEILPRLPVCRVVNLRLLDPTQLLYTFSIGTLGFDQSGTKESCRPKVGDVFAITNEKPRSAAGLRQGRQSLNLALVRKVDDDPVVTVRVSRTIERQSGFSLFVVYLVNLTTNIRIWSALRGHTGVDCRPTTLNLVKNVLNRKEDVLLVPGACDLCSDDPITADLDRFNLNASQKSAIEGALSASSCSHSHQIRLIWGPPGTGKTKTVSVLLWVLLGTKCRTLVCAPTNVAVLEVASRLLDLVKKSCTDVLCSLGNVVLFGSKERMKVEGDDLEDFFLDSRVGKLARCFGPLSGWEHELAEMVALLDDPFLKYTMYLELHEEKEKKEENGNVQCTEFVMTFQQFFSKRFSFLKGSVMDQIRNLITHLPTSFLPSGIILLMLEVYNSLGASESLLQGGNPPQDKVERRSAEGNVNDLEMEMSSPAWSNLLALLRSLLRSLKLPNFSEIGHIRDFCLKNASVIFCTVSSSDMLYSVKMDPLDILVIDEAAQLKECESLIPLQLPKMRHAILIGDELQLSALVKSKFSDEANFGRSLFERLVSLGYSKCLLNVQYRMHPEISSFPNKNFYNKQILDGDNVKDESYKRQYLDGPIFGPYSFINVDSGEEIYLKGRSPKNLAEVAVVSQIVKNLFEASVRLKRTLSVGIISPYTAQVVAIQETLGNIYECCSFFSLSVKTVDGFQGGEEDVIIISTVRSNQRGEVGFLDNHRRTNVALTRARHCLWIIGNGSTLMHKRSVWKESGSSVVKNKKSQHDGQESGSSVVKNKESQHDGQESRSSVVKNKKSQHDGHRRSKPIWKRVILDAKERGCFYEGHEDKSLADAIIKLHLELQQHDILLCEDSLVFRSRSWKVLFTDNFKKSFASIENVQMQVKVIELLVRFSNGWQPEREDGEDPKDSKIELLQQYNLQNLCILWSVNALHDSEHDAQVLKFWDVVPQPEIYPEHFEDGRDLVNDLASLSLEPELLAEESGAGASGGRFVSDEESR